MADYNNAYKVGEYSTSAYDWKTWIFVLIIIIIIAIIILFIIGSIQSTRTNSINTFGVSWRIQRGKTTGSTDVMTTGGNNLYIGQTPEALTLSISPSNDNEEGREIAIKNNSTQNIILKGGSGVTLREGQLSLTVIPGQTAIFVCLGGDDFLRLQ